MDWQNVNQRKSVAKKTTIDHKKNTKTKCYGCSFFLPELYSDGVKL